MKCGDYNIITVVDANSNIDESDETNNDKIKPITIDCGESVERALIIGINANDISQHAVNSAKGMYKLLRYGYRYDPNNILLLLDENATKSNITSGIDSMSYKTDKNDKMVFYYAGHGTYTTNTKEEGLLSYDSQSMKNLDELFDINVLGMNAFDGDLIAIFDTCYSGGFCKETDFYDGKPDGVPSGIDGDKRVVLMSTEASKELRPYIGSKLKFTEYLIKAFASHKNEADSNSNQNVSIEEAFDYAKDKGIVLGWLQHPQIMDHYLDNLNREPELYISNNPIINNYTVGEGGSSVHIHAYDIEGRHVGTIDSDNIVTEIPGAWYSGPESHPEEIIIFGIMEDITFMIEGQLDETFNFTIRQFANANETIVNYYDVPIKETGIATVDISEANPTYTMEIDDNGDGISDYTTEPDSIDIVGPNDDWKEEWTGENTDGGTSISTTELQDAIHHWLEDIKVRDHLMSTMDIQEIIAMWLSG